MSSPNVSSESAVPLPAAALSASGLLGVVVDASVLIKGMRVDDIVDKYQREASLNENSTSNGSTGSGGGATVELFTVVEVLNEVRNHFAREQLQFSPYQFTVREPAGEFLNLAIDFAKATGDYPSLSLPDLKIIALSCQLEWELARRKVDPAPTRPVTLLGKPQGAPADAGHKNPEGFYFPKQQRQQQDGEEARTSVCLS